MRWIVGIDGQPWTAGALKTAARLGSNPGQRLVGVQVVPAAGMRDDEIDERCGQAQDRAKATLDDLKIAGAFDRIEAIAAETAEDGLANATGAHAADGLVVGRRGPRDVMSIVRLGRVARRLVRRLPAALMIVPPDHDPADSPGPIVVATDLTAASEPAARLAARLAEDLRTDLVCIHAVRGDTPADSDLARAETDRVRQWLEPLAIGDVTPIAVEGDVVERVASYAHDHRATAIVVGARGLTGIARLFRSSAGTDLARFADRPVVIVPPPGHASKS